MPRLSPDDTKTSWTVEGMALYVKTTSPDTSPPKESFGFRGACYQRLRRGENPGAGAFIDPLADDRTDLWSEDLIRLRMMGANAIRVFNTAPDVPHRAFLDRAWNDGDRPIHVLLSIWIEPEQLGVGNDAYVTNTRDSYSRLVASHKQHPAVVGFVIGGEVNDRDSRLTEAFWTDFRTIAEGARSALGSPGQTGYAEKILTTALINDFGETSSLDVALQEFNGRHVIDVWGFDLYPSPDEAVFNNAKRVFDRLGAPATPLLIGEFGDPASTHQSSDGLVRPLTPEEAERHADYMAETCRKVATYRKPSGARVLCGVGGCIFEWSDEWWKQGRPGEGPQDAFPYDPLHHNSGFKLAGSGFFMTKYYDEEWFGLNGITEDGALVEREVYRRVGEEWYPGLAKWAGTYDTEVAWGGLGAEGPWHQAGELVIADGEVHFRGKQITAFQYANHRLSWNWDGDGQTRNDNVAAITLSPTTLAGYHWKDPNLRQSFTGAFNDNPAYGLVDFRGVLRS